MEKSWGRLSETEARLPMWPMADETKVTLSCSCSCSGVSSLASLVVPSFDPFAWF
jgi:hypothetical protein